MNNFWDQYYNIARMPTFLLVTAVIYLVSQVTIMTVVHPLGPFTVLNLQTTFSVDQFLSIINSWESQGLMKYYNEHYFYDNVHPVWYGFFLSSGLAATFHRDGTDAKYRKFLALPFIAGICDMIENHSHHLFLSDLSYLNQFTISISAFFCYIKWILFAGTILFLIYRLIAYQVKKFS